MSIYRLVHFIGCFVLNILLHRLWGLGIGTQKLKSKCVVPENIQTSTTEVIGNSRWVGGLEAQEIPAGGLDNKITFRG